MVAIPTRPVYATYLDPEGMPKTGYVEFTLTTDVNLSNTAIIHIDTVRANLDANGRIDANLIVSDDPLVQPTGLIWCVDEKIENGNVWYIQIPKGDGSPVDLTTLFIPGLVPPGYGISGVQGPPGPPGPQGPQGPPGIASTNLVQKFMCEPFFGFYDGSTNTEIFPSASQGSQGLAYANVNGVEKLYVLQHISGSYHMPDERKRIVEFTLAENGSVVNNTGFSELLSIGHQNISARVVGPDVYLYATSTVVDPYTGNDAGKGFSKTRWRGSATSQSDVTNYQLWGYKGSGHKFENLYGASVTVSSDGKYLIMSGGDSPSPGDEMYDFVQVVCVYDLAEVEAATNPLTVDPIYFNYLNAPHYGDVQQGVACDGKFFYILRGGINPLTSHSVEKYTFTGQLVETLQLDDVRIMHGWDTLMGNPTLGNPISMEPEGITIRGSELLILVMDVWRVNAPVVSYRGRNYASIRSNNLNYSPDDELYWIRTNNTASGAWDPAITYGIGTRLTRASKLVYSIRVPKGDPSEEGITQGNSSKISGASLAIPANPVGLSWKHGEAFTMQAFSKNTENYYYGLTYSNNSLRIYDQRATSDNSKYMYIAAYFDTNGPREYVEVRARDSGLSNGAGFNLYGKNDRDTPGGISFWPYDVVSQANVGWYMQSDGKFRPGSDLKQDIGTAIQRIRDTYSTTFRPGDGTAIITSCTGSPEGVITANVGSFCIRLDGTPTTYIYQKVTGTGNTGWVPFANTGPTGPQGPQGNPGIPGPAGAQGLQGEVYVQSTTTGAPGTSATVTDSDASINIARLNFTIPRGDVGATGATGPQGATGNTGAQGPQGVKGDTGAQGPQGNPGAPGATGPAGPGVPVGGLAGQALTKKTGTDYDTQWTTVGGGGGAPTGPAGGDLAGSYPNPDIAAGVIVDADVNATAAIAQSKIANLTTDLASKATTAALNAMTLDGLADVTSPTPGDGVPLRYDSASSQWKPSVNADHFRVTYYRPISGSAGRLLNDGGTFTALRWATSGVSLFADSNLNGGGTGVLGIANATTVPTGDQANASLLYVEGGLLKLRNADAVGPGIVATRAYADAVTAKGNAGGDLSGTYPNPQIAAGAIVDADVNTAAAIATSKIAGLDTALTGKVATSRQVLAGTGLSGGGALTADVTLTVNRAVTDTWYAPASIVQGVVRSVNVISGATTAAAAAKTDYVYICSALLTLTLPTAVGNSNIYTVKRSGTGDITIATTASQTIDGAATFVIDTQYMSIDLVSDGTNWVVI